ncbi:MAG: BamA/TamA family outer membrane protein, partial [Bacteroidota bacterium]
FELTNISSLFVPKTRITAGIRLQHRLQYFQMFSTDASFGYHWKESASKEHIFNPFSLTFAQLTRTTEKFDELLRINQLLRKSFEEQFILGHSYTFTYNDQMNRELTNHLYFQGNIDLSGNLLQLIQSLFVEGTASPAAPYKIFGTIYSEYYKFDIDLRYYYNNLAQTSSLAGRIIAGLGVAYGNSATLPYVKQFYIGGSNSVRAFPARGLGPGTYIVPDSLSATSFIDQAGDLKLEGNIEYRFPIISFLKGALFVDAGNIWLLHNDPNRSGGVFSGKTFMEQLAVGTGFGFRFDLSFLILRFDLAFPLRIPSLPEYHRWVINAIDVVDPTWRKDNLALNIAIGYPF